MIWASFINALAEILRLVVNLYMWVVIFSAIFSLVRADATNRLVDAIYRLTEPVFGWIRRHIPCIFGGLDLSPLIVIVALKFFDLFFIGLLKNYA